jgi:gas vesicle protein
MNNDSNKSSGNFFSGFIIGALVGAAIVFFLGTKKGKKLLRIISEEGMDNLNNLIEKADKATGLDEVYEEEEPSFASTFAKASAYKKATEGQGKTLTHKEEVSHEEPRRIRRFFKGISRRTN